MKKKYRTAQVIAAETPWRERDVMTAEEVAGVLMISKTAAYVRLASGEIPGRLPGRHTVRVSVPAFRRYLGELPEVPRGPKKGAA